MPPEKLLHSALLVGRVQVLLWRMTDMSFGYGSSPFIYDFHMFSLDLQQPSSGNDPLRGTCGFGGVEDRSANCV
jgi:hypothetical protein